MESIYYCSNQRLVAYCGYDPSFYNCESQYQFNCGTRWSCATGMPLVPAEDCIINTCRRLNP